MQPKLCPTVIRPSTESFTGLPKERLRVSGNPRQYDNLEVFARKQEMMRTLVARSRIPSFAVDILDTSVTETPEKTADWLEATDGLSLANH